MLSPWIIAVNNVVVLSVDTNRKGTHPEASGELQRALDEVPYYRHFHL